MMVPRVHNQHRIGRTNLGQERRRGLVRGRAERRGGRQGMAEVAPSTSPKKRRKHLSKWPWRWVRISRGDNKQNKQAEARRGEEIWIWVGSVQAETEEDE